MKILKSVFVVGSIVFVVLIGVYIYYFNRYKSALDQTTKAKVTITIEKGDNAKNIAKYLKDINIIEDGWVFEWYVKEKKLEKKILAGDFVLEAGINIPKIVDIITNNTQIRVTIPEGYTIKDIDKLLKSKGITKSIIGCSINCDFSDFSFLNLDRKNPLEGYLFPDTYFISKTGFDEKKFLDKLLHNFEDKVYLPNKDLFSSSNRTLDEVVNMASMIEKEALTYDERYIISGILWKRLDEGIALGVDATLRYEASNWETELTYKQLKTNTPFNTRLNLGLPPTPISNPGLESILAALKPRSSKYYYYLHDKNQNIHYSVTNQEHSAKKLKYL